MSAPRARQYSETKLSRSIKQSLERMGFWVIRIPSGKVQVIRGGRQSWIVMAPKGTPDLLVLAPYVWLEVKGAKGTVSPEQREWHRRAEERGVRVAVVRSVAEAIAAVKGAA